MATRGRTKDEELKMFEGFSTQSSGQAWNAFNDAEQRSREAEQNNPAFHSSKHLKKINGVLDVLRKYAGKTQLFELVDYYKNSRDRGFTVIKTIFGFDMKTFNIKNIKKNLKSFGVEDKDIVGTKCKKPGHINLKINIHLS